MRGDGSLSRLVSRMGESVDGVKDTFRPGRWNDRSVLSCGNVTEDGEVAHPRSGVQYQMMFGRQQSPHFSWSLGRLR